MTIFRTALLAALLLPALLHAQELFKGATALPLPFQPGERQVTRLLDLGDLYGIVAGDGQTLQFVRIELPAGDIIEEDAPMPISPALVTLLGNPDRPLVVDMPNQCGYTLTDSGKLARVSIIGGITELGQVAGTRPFEDKTGFQISRAIVRGPDGAFYTAGAQGAIFRLDPNTQKVEKLAASLPAVKGREAWASLDAAVLGPDNLIYGGTFDGYLFTFDVKTKALVNLGKPFREQRIQGLAFRKGLLIGIGGDEDGIPRAFAYDPAIRGFTLGGPLPGAVTPNNYEPIITLTATLDGTILYSTGGRMGNLFIWKP